MKICGIIEEKQKIKSSNDILVMNTKKEQEKEKRKRKIEYKQAKFLLYDEIMKECTNLKDLNELLYNINLRDKILTNVIDNLFINVLQYKNVSNELNEDINLFLMEIYNTTAGKVITIKNKELKELERIEKEKMQEELKKQLLLNYEKTQKQENLKKQEEKELKKQFKIYIIIFIVFLFILLLIAK